MVNSGVVLIEELSQGLASSEEPYVKRLVCVCGWVGVNFGTGGGQSSPCSDPTGSSRALSTS